MEKIVLEIHSPAEPLSRFITVTGDTVSIGRGLNNDVIVPDPFMDATHIVLTLTPEEWNCQDNASLNGTFLVRPSSAEKAAAARITERSIISSGDTLLAGHTSIRIWNPLHPVPAAEPLRDLQGQATGISKPVLPDILLAITLYYLLFFYLFSLGNPKNNIPYMELLSTITLMLGGLAIWAGFWALITRFSRHQHGFGKHFLFACRMIILVSVISVILRIIDFYLSGHIQSMITELLVIGCATVFALYHHMRLATHLPSRKRLLVASLIILPLLGVTVMIEASRLKNFDPEPRHSLTTIYLPETLVPTTPLTTTLERMNSVFH